MQHSLQAFHGELNEKLQHMAATTGWLETRKKPKSPAEITDAIFNPIREFKEADIAIEDFSGYPEVLGLPLWLGYLNRTIDHHSSSGIDFRNEGYEYTYYPEFLLACRQGVDYTKMLFPWQLFLLKEFIPEPFANDSMLADIIQLHENAAAGELADNDHWRKAQTELEDLLNRLKVYKSLSYHLRRTAYLSVEEVMDIENLWTSSAEAAADAKIQYILDKDPGAREEQARKMVWQEIRVHLLAMLNNWR